MIYGEYRDGFPYVTLKIEEGERDLSVRFLVDTGFEGHVSLPNSMIGRLGLPRLFLRRNRFANGEESSTSVHAVDLRWNGKVISTEAVALENAPLLGNQLLENCNINIEAVEGGEVTIEPLV